MVGQDGTGQGEGESGDVRDDDKNNKTMRTVTTADVGRILRSASHVQRVAGKIVRLRGGTPSVVSAETSTR